jgi:aminocarboxymuconate-semialdehyde decarboxylase
VWAKAEELGVTLFIHPQSTPELAKRFKGNGWLSNVIGNPLDTTIALTHLIFSGVLERHPNLKIVAAHGGGYLPSYFPRTIHGFEVRPEAQTIPQPPDYYLKQLWVDALVYDPRNVAHVVERMGSSRVLLGTDYPFDMGEEQPLEVLAAVPGLSDADRQRIKVDNALELLGMAVAV